MADYGALVRRLFEMNRARGVRRMRHCRPPRVVRMRVRGWQVQMGLENMHALCRALGASAERECMADHARRCAAPHARTVSGMGVVHVAGSNGARARAGRDLRWMQSARQGHRVCQGRQRSAAPRGATR
jgi:hypothetical protein